MGVVSRVRLNLSLDVKVVERLRLAAKKYGFKTPTEMATAALLLILSAVERETIAPTEADDIERMFAEYADAELPDYTKQYKRRRNNGLEEGNL